MDTLGTCTYCSRTGRAKNLTKISFHPEFDSYYCPRCLPVVRDNIKDDLILKEDLEIFDRMTNYKFVKRF